MSMKLLTAAWVAGLAVLSAGAVQAEAPVQASAPVAVAAPAARDTVILISIDGFRAEYLQRGLTPTLSALAAHGVRAKAMRPSFPSITFPNHYTLVTGLRPDHHGIVSNTMRDPAIPGVTFKLSDRDAVTDERWWDDATPIWVSAERQGVRTATMFWPGSEAAIHGVRPHDWRTFDQKLGAEQRVDTVLGWLDAPAESRPAFLTLYFDAVDTAGHYHGPHSPELTEALKATDAALKRLVDGLKARGLFDKVDLVVVSDHGMTDTAPERMIELEPMFAPGQVQIVGTGAIAGIQPEPGQEAAVEKMLLAPQPHMTCWRKADIPAKLHYGTHRRVPPIFCLAEKGWLIEARPRKGSPLRGEHGYDPADPDMAALFVAHGPAFRRGVVLKPFDNVDVYPLLAKLLDVKPEANDGRLKDVAGALKAR